MSSEDVEHDQSAAVTGAGADVPRGLRVACAVLALQALALLAIAGFVVYATVTGRPNSVGRALLGALFAVLTALALGAAARSLLRLRPAARTPVVVLEALFVPVGYSLGFQAGRVGYGGPVLISALVVLYLLFTPPVRAVLDRDPPV